MKLEVTLLGRTEVKALAENVSVGGLFLKMDAPTGKMQLIRMKLVLPTDGQELVVHGVGKHVVDRASGSPVPGVGVAFFGFDGPQLKRWEAYVQHVSLAQASSRLLHHATPPAFGPQPTSTPYPVMPQRIPPPPPATPVRAALPPPLRGRLSVARAPARPQAEIVLDEGDLEFV